MHFYYFNNKKLISLHYYASLYIITNFFFLFNLKLTKFDLLFPLSRILFFFCRCRTLCSFASFYYFSNNSTLLCSNRILEECFLCFHYWHFFFKSSIIDSSKIKSSNINKEHVNIEILRSFSKRKSQAIDLIHH